MTTEQGDPQDVTLREYARVVWRRKWVVVAVTVVVFVLALAYSSMKTPLYEASATLIYESSINVADPLSGSSYNDSSRRETELNAVASIITSPELVQSARETMTQAQVAQIYKISADPASSPGQTSASTVSISAVSPNAKTASDAANAYANAFVAFKKNQQQEQVRQAEAVVQRRLDTFQTPASKQSVEYQTLAQTLQDLQIMENTVTGNFRVLVPATPPNVPFSPRPVRTGVMGLAAGLVLGIGLALLLEQFDTRVRSSDEAASILRMPVLGTVRKHPKKELDTQSLVVVSDSRGPAAEAIRKLRGSLEFANVDGDLRSLFITSALQHEGKSLTVCNLALSLAATGTRVVLVDGDLRRPQDHVYLDLPNKYGLSTVLTGRTELLAALQSRTVGPRLTGLGASGKTQASSSERLHILTSGPLPPNPAEMIASKSFANVMAELREDFEMVLVDAPSVLAVGDTAAIARCVDGVAFLVDLTRARRPVLEEAARQIAQMPCRKVGLVLVGRAASDSYASYYAHGESPLDAVSGNGGRGRKLRT